MEKESFRKLLADACAEFLEKHRALLEMDSNERAITGTIGGILRGYIKDWDVDTEHNRMADDVAKRFAAKDLVIPDIVVHKRRQGGAENDLAVIEAKKSSHSKKDILAALNTLRRFREDDYFKYRYAYLLLARVGSEKPGLFIFDSDDPETEAKIFEFLKN